MKPGGPEGITGSHKRLPPGLSESKIVFSKNRKLPRVTSRADVDECGNARPGGQREASSTADPLIECVGFYGETRRQSKLHRRAHQVPPRFVVPVRRPERY